MSELINSRKQKIYALPMLTLDFNVVVDILDFSPKKQKSNIIIPDNQIYTPDNVGVVRNESIKEKENDIYNMFEATDEHPFQAVVIATNEQMVEKGLKVGTIIYCGIGLFLARSVVQVNGVQYPIVGSSQVLGIVDQVELEVLQIESKNL